MKQILLTLAGLLFASSAMAHHPLGGLPMETFTHGLLSGVGHPVLGFDHLFFVIIVGIAAAMTPAKRMAPAAYIGAMLVGCFLMYAGQGLPAKEVMIGLSLLVVGGIVLSGRALSLVPMMAIFAAFGLFHGSAFGDSLATQEAAMGAGVLLGYFLGLGVIQYAIAMAAGWVSQNIWKAADATALQPRLAGAMVAGVGLFLTLENIEGPVLQMITG